MYMIKRKLCLDRELYCRHTETFLPAVDVLIKIEIKMTQNKTLETKDVQAVNSLY